MLFAIKPSERLMLNKEGEKKIREMKPVQGQRAYFEKRADKIRSKQNADGK